MPFIVNDNLQVPLGVLFHSEQYNDDTCMKEILKEVYKYIPSTARVGDGGSGTGDSSQLSSFSFHQSFQSMYLPLLSVHTNKKPCQKISLLTLGACASEGYSSWSVCLSVCPVEISFYVRLHQPDIVPTVYK